MTNKQIREMTFKYLKGNWGNAIVIGVAFIAMLLLALYCHITNFLAYQVMGFGKVGFRYHNVSLVQIIVSSLLNCAFSVCIVMAYYTINRQFIDMARGHDYNLSRNIIMKNKRHFFKLSFKAWATKVFIIFLCIVPGVFGYDSAKNLSQLADQAEKLSVFTLFCFMMSVFMVLVSIVLTINSILSLHLLQTLVLLNPMMPIRQAVSLCFKQADGNKTRIITYYLSIIKYLPLIVLVYPILVLFPYYLMSNLVLCEGILGKELTKDTFLETFVEKHNDAPTTPKPA